MRYLIGLALLLISVSSSAHVFFKLEHPQQPTSYLFGTMHLICQADVDIPPVVQQAFVETAQLVVEINLTDEAQIAEMRANLTQQPTDYLTQHLSSADEQKLAELIERVLQIPYVVAKEMRPFLIQSMFLQHYLDCDGNSLLVDQALIERANHANKPVIGLETALQQLQLFDSIPLADQVASLVDVAFNPNTTKQDMIELEQRYLDDDSTKLYEYITTQDEFTAEFEQIMLAERNQRWIEQFKEILPQQPTFIAVGAGHLGGSHGLIQLLQQHGYKLTPITVNFSGSVAH